MMFMLYWLVVTAFLFLAAVVPSIDAFGTGAGSCPAGRPAVDALHLRSSNNRKVQTGSLAQGGFQLVVNGMALVEAAANQPEVGATTTTTTAVAIPVGVDVVWTLTTTAATKTVATATASDDDDDGNHHDFFRGFLLRLDGGDDEIDTVGALLPLPSESKADDETEATNNNNNNNNNVTVARGVCHLLNEVGGVTHTTNAPKTSVSGLLHVADNNTSRNLQLEVTVVVENRLFSSIFYYSGFVLDVLPSLTRATTSDEDEEGCSASHPCGMCEGDCNRDSDCHDGLACFRRPGMDDSLVEGCYGRGDPGKSEGTTSALHCPSLAQVVIDCCTLFVFCIVAALTP